MMKKTMNAVLALLLLAAAESALAQVYKWVDQRGVTHFSDQPPPPDQQKVEIKAADGSGGGVALPYEVAMAVRAAPVTLYTTTACEACDGARKLLQQRGVPYTEKSIVSADDQAQLRQAGGSNQLPFIVIGAVHQAGFEEGALNNALTGAGYPATRKLPSNYKFAAAAPAAPRKPSAEQQAQQRAAAARAAAEEAERNKKLAAPAFQF
jgi:glutaredoxin